MAITYTPTTNFGAKDSLPTNDPDKVIKGSEFTTEFSAIQTSFSLAAPAASPTFTGDVTLSNGDMLFGDDNKAIFGDGSDLQIYHDGSNSYISDQGSGTLKIQGDSQVRLESTAGERYFVGSSNGAARLYYDDSEKLATTATGIDVTGTVTADGYTFDSEGQGITFITSSAPRPSIKSGDITFTNGLEIDSDNGLSLTYDGNDNLVGGVSIKRGSALKAVFLADQNGDISFYEDTGTTPKFFWDASAESLGIGTTSPDTGLQCAITNYTFSGTTYDIYGLFGDTSGGIRLGADSSNDDSVIGTTGTNNLQFVTYDGSAWASRMTLTNTGNVGIGTTSPATPLDVTTAGGGNFVATFQNTTSATPYGVSIKEPASAANGYPSFQITDSAGASVRLRVDSGTGNVGIGESNPAEKLEVAGNILLNASNAEINLRSGVTGTSGAINWTFNTDASDFASIKLPYDDRNTTGLHIDSGYPITIDASGFGTIFAQSGSEKARIDSSGNLLVGTTSAPESSGGGAGFVASTSSRRILQLATTSTSSNTLQTFNNPNGTVGSVVTSASATSFNTSSDARLKENIADAEDAGATVDAIQVRSFDWKADGSHQRYGMVAQELLEVAPEAVSGDPESDDMMGVDYSKLVPMMLKEIQSLRARVAQLEGA